MEAALSAGDVLYLILLWAICLSPAVVTALKGHVTLFVIGFLTLGLVWVIACFRLAKPNSPWARRFYGEEKMRRSRQRYPEIDPSQPNRSLVVLAVGFALLALPFMGGFVAGKLEQDDDGSEVREPARAAPPAAP
ncbi:MAG TPA: hypothetical protein VEQ41_03970 [Solirubrobacterales bacterium]|nr:hypothetical protein [Solirubrobacterales bacterium]